MFRPAGSSEDSDSEYEFYDHPKKVIFPCANNDRANIEENLKKAVVNDELDEVVTIINGLSNGVNSKLDSGWTPLIHACFNAQEKIVKQLLDMGADPNLAADSFTPLMAVCSNSLAENDVLVKIVEHLIQRGCMLHGGDKYGITAMMRAIGNARTTVVQKLLDNNTNFEARDSQGWTAVFWAAYNNRPEILQMLIEKGARLEELDISNQTPLQIAEVQGYDDIVAILENNIVKNEDNIVDELLDFELKSWKYLYPGVEKSGLPDYTSELASLLYAMRCEKLGKTIQKSGIDLKTFLLLEEEGMINIGIEMPYLRQRVMTGLRKFHTKKWELSSVQGLDARKVDNYTVMDCLTVLGAHLQQAYVMEATLEYTMRELFKIQSEIKLEPSDSPTIKCMKTAVSDMRSKIKQVKIKIQSLKNVLTKIRKNNPPVVADIKEKSTLDIVKEYVSKPVFVCSLGLCITTFFAKTYFVKIIAR